jgi:flagellar hook-associated protein 3 FlgL
MKVSGFPGFDAAVAASALVRTRVSDLTAQAASGQRAQTFAGLGEDAALALDLRSERARREAFAAAGRRGEAFAEATQIALGGIHGAARDILDNGQRVLINGLPGSDGASIKTMAETARASLKTIVGLLGERFAGDAVFGGAAPDQAPIVSAAAIETTGLFTGIRAQVQTLGPGNGHSILAATKALAQSNNSTISPFQGFAADAASGSQSDARRSVPVGEDIAIPVGMYAYRNASAVSEGHSIGGSDHWGMVPRPVVEPLHHRQSGASQRSFDGGLSCAGGGSACGVALGFERTCRRPGSLGRRAVSLGRGYRAEREPRPSA